MHLSINGKRLGNLFPNESPLVIQTCSALWGGLGIGSTKGQMGGLVNLWRPLLLHYFATDIN